MDIHHGMIVRDNPPDRLFAALTQQSELAVWMDAPTLARPGVGAILEFHYAGGKRTLQLEVTGLVAAHYASARAMAEQDNEYGQACFAAVSGNLAEALRLQEIALTRQQVQPGWARIDPELSMLTDDPRFKALIEQEMTQATQAL